MAARFEIPVAFELVEPPSTSGFKNRGRDRPKFQELLRLIDAGAIDAVVIYNTDRLSRGGGVGWTPLLEAIERAGHDANRFILRPDGWLGEFELGIRATIDREEASKTSARMRDVRAREAREGTPRPTILRSYGYVYDPSTKTLEIVDSEAETIREAVDRVLDGEPIYRIARDFNRRKVPTVKGGPWRSSVLNGVVRSARIAGLRSHHGEVVGFGLWKPIISEDEHHRVLAITNHRGSRGVRTAARTFPLTGFLRCGRCSTPLRSQRREGGGRRYSCRNSDGLDGCGGIHVKAEFVEDAVRDYVLGVLTDPVTKQRLLAAAPEPDNARQRAVLKELQDLDIARQRLTDLAVDGTIPPGEVRRKTAELDAHQDRLERQLAAIPQASALRGLPLSVDELTAPWSETVEELVDLAAGAQLDPAMLTGPLGGRIPVPVLLVGDPCPPHDVLLRVGRLQRGQTFPHSDIVIRNTVRPSLVVVVSRSPPQPTAARARTTSKANVDLLVPLEPSYSSLRCP